MGIVKRIASPNDQLSCVNDQSPSTNTVRILLLLLAHPYRYTLRELSDRLEKSRDATNKYLDHLRAAGLDVQYDKLFRYAVLPDMHLKELQRLNPLSAEDIGTISTMVDTAFSTADALYFKEKLNSLYDFQQLGIRALRRPALERIDRLEDARQRKRVAILHNYHSNSGSIRDRRVEPFHIDAELDTLHAYDLDLEKKAIRHFLLSRIERVSITDTPWQYEHYHAIQRTDVFRISNDRQVFVSLELDIYARNSLIEHYPKAQADLSKGADEETWIFESQVNHEFLGVVNFICGNLGHVLVLKPAGLRAAVLNHIEEKINTV